MKRYLCSDHINHLKTQGKSIVLDSKKCTVCRWKSRPPSPLKILQNTHVLAEVLEDSILNPEYDPTGVVMRRVALDAFRSFVMGMHPVYREHFMEDLKKEVEEAKARVLRCLADAVD